jgi:hypothetical protein
MGAKTFPFAITGDRSTSAVTPSDHVMVTVQFECATALAIRYSIRSLNTLQRLSLTSELPVQSLLLSPGANLREIAPAQVSGSGNNGAIVDRNLAIEL